MKNRRAALIKDALIILFSVIIAGLLAQSNAVAMAVSRHETWKFLDSFAAGLFFVSIFTVTPAAVILTEIAKTGSWSLVALCAAGGALIGDWLIFLFIKDSLAADFLYLAKLTGLQKITKLFRRRVFRWLLPLLGAVVIASPLPDELGLMMLGLSKIKTWQFALLTFIINFLGIWLLLFLVGS